MASTKTISVDTNREKAADDFATRVMIESEEEDETSSSTVEDDNDYDYYEYEDSGSEWYTDPSIGDSKKPEDRMLFNIDPVSCPICFTIADSGSAIKLFCEHSFCIDCFQRYIQSSIIEAGKANRVVCPVPDCNAVVDSDIVKEIMDEKDAERFEKLRTDAFVLENADYHHCPTPDCSNIVYWKLNYGPPIVDCYVCQKVSCLKCGVNPFHTALSCDEWKERKEKRERKRKRCRIELLGRQNRNQAKAKELLIIEEQNAVISSEDRDNKLIVRCCRRCGNGVELSSGCFKMKCRCGYRFCFACGSENAQCDCTPKHHGFVDNRSGRGDFSGLRSSTSFT